MNTKSGLRKICSLAMIGVLATTSAVFAVEGVEKDETVYVNLFPDGSTEEIIVSDWIHSNDSGIEVKDESILENIKNVKGEEIPEIDGENVTWNLNGTDIFYQGNTDKKLPVEVRIKYSLDEEEIMPLDLAGKSGRVRIELELKNNEMHTATINEKNRLIYTPFTSIAIVNLPMEKFTNLDINTGELVSDGNNRVITYISLPGMKDSLPEGSDFFDIPEKLIIEADVTEFEIGTIMITTTSKLPDLETFEDMDKVSELIDAIDEMRDASSKLSEATGLIADGQNELAINLNKFEAGVQKLGTGAEELVGGINKLGTGSKSAYDGAIRVAEGVNLLAENTSKLGEGATAFGAGATEFASKTTEFADGANQVAAGVGQIAEKTGELVVGSHKLEAGTEELKKGQEQLIAGITQSLVGVESLRNGKLKEMKVLGLLINGMDMLIESVSKLEQVPLVKDVAVKISEGLDKQKEGLEGLENSGNEFLAGLDQLEEGLKAAEQGSKRMSSELAKLHEGQESLTAGVEKLSVDSAQLKPVVKKLQAGSEGLNQGAVKLTESAKSLDEGSKQFVNGVGELVVGSQAVADGLGELSFGADKLVAGTVEFDKGSQELLLGASQLASGASKLSDGTKELDVNMKKFHEEGVMKLNNEVKDKVEKIEELTDIKDELVKLSESYNTFSGLGDGMDGNVKFVMKTAEIKAPKEEVKVVVVEKEEDEGFLGWIKNKVTSIFN